MLRRLGIALLITAAGAVLIVPIDIGFQYQEHLRQSGPFQVNWHRALGRMLYPGLLGAFMGVLPHLLGRKAKPNFRHYPPGEKLPPGV